MDRETRELVKWAGQFGWSLDEAWTGSGHPVLSHTSGERYTVAGTPSDWRSLANTRADLLRIAGVGSQSGPAAKYRHKRNPDAFSMDATLDGRAARAENLLPTAIERLELRLRYYDLLSVIRQLHPRRDQVRVHKLAAEAGAILRRLRHLDR